MPGWGPRRGCAPVPQPRLVAVDVGGHTSTRGSSWLVMSGSLILLVVVVVTDGGDRCGRFVCRGGVGAGRDGTCIGKGEVSVGADRMGIEPLFGLGDEFGRARPGEVGGNIDACGDGIGTDVGGDAEGDLGDLDAVVVNQCL